MRLLLTELTLKFNQAIKLAFPDIEIPQNLVEVVPSSQDKFGHYQCNSAMKLAGLTRLKPRDVAQKIVEHLDKGDMIASCEIAGPGFINVRLNTAYLSKRTTEMLHDSRLGIDKIHPKQKLVLDFSSPNAAKEMQVWHLRSTIIGDSLARLFEFLGYDVLRISHIGDWGTAFGMLIAYMKETKPNLSNTNLAQLVQWYKAAKTRFDEDPDFKKRSQLEVVALQQGDVESIKTWQIICDISSKGYKEIYDLLDVHLIERGESFYNPMLADVVRDLESKKMITQSDGAKCIFLEGFANREGEILPIIIQKSDGGYNYSTTDLAAVQHRVKDEGAQRLIYVTDAGQSLHFKMIFKAAELAGYYDPANVRVDHVGFGLVLDQAGKKFKTRSSETEPLMDLLKAAIERAKSILIERQAEMSEAELNHTATVLGINAIKYADLSNNRTSDYVFSYDRMLRFEGNTAAFLMYSYVRINGIKRKVGKNISTIKTPITLEHPSEIALALHLNQFGEALEGIANDLNPHRLADYLYTLAERFNAFFRDCRVEGDKAEDSRLLLAETVARVMKQGMNILGLNVVDKM